MNGPVRVAFLDLRSINDRFNKSFADVARRVADRGRWVLGPEVSAFETEFGRYCGCRHVVAVGNGLDALELVLRAWGIGSGDEVIVPGNTFIATWLAVHLVGATPVPVDPSPLTHTIDVSAVAAAITDRTRAVIPVHLYGRIADMNALASLCRPRSIHLLEDAAQAHGAKLHGQRAGTLGDAAAFSFYPAKNLGALGDGGAVTTNDDRLAETVRKMANYGSSQRYVHEIAGRNSRLDELQAGFLRAKLERLEEDNARRAALAVRYTHAFGELGLGLPAQVGPGDSSAWHLYVIRHANRDALRHALASRGIETHVHYPCPPSRQAVFAGHSCARVPLPISEQLAREVLSLPIGPTLDDLQVEQVIEAMRECVRELGSSIIR